MRVAVFDVHPFEEQLLQQSAKKLGHSLTLFRVKLDPSTAIMAKGFSVVASFAHDTVNATAIKILADNGVNLIALRSAGFNHVDLRAAQDNKIKVVRVPEYSPYSVAEHAVAMTLSLNRKLTKAFNRVRELNFSLDGLVGFDMHGKTVGVIGAGRIGKVSAQIFAGFGCKILVYDKKPDMKWASSIQAHYVELPDLLQRSDIISLHLPLVPETKHLIGAAEFKIMKQGVFLINTGRGALIDAKALIDSLKRNHVGAAGLDVYEEEENIFFHDLSEKGIQDDILARLLTFPNVLITSHQGFLTHEALSNIAETTMSNITDFEAGRTLVNEVVWTG